MPKAARARTRTSATGSDRAARGFTLLELIVVLGLVALVLTLSVPLLSNAFPGVELRSAASDLAAVLRSARNRAITDNRPVELRVDLESRRYALAGGDRIEHLPDDVAIAMQMAGSADRQDGIGRIRFFPDGSNTGGRISLTRGERTYHVRVHWLLGRVSVSE